ncbi:MAG TPA: M13 family metallopeptidase [Gemmatimonadaceae bacterium]|nr:M13 family metallopeptidase [Gemmatimonadaceae bacterium]
MLSFSFYPFPAAEVRAQAPRGHAASALESTVDIHIKPGDDFFGYANGAWLKAAVIPDGKDRWSVRDDIDEVTRRQVVAILDDARSARPGSLARKVADFRAALLNQAAIDEKGLAALAPSLSRIDRVGDKLALTRLLGSTMHADVDPLNLGVYASSSVLGLSVEHSIHGEKTYTPFLLQGGLGLGDRDRYLSKESRAAEQRTRYQKYIAQLLTLAGFDRAAQRADSVLALETAIAASQAASAATSVDRNADNQWSHADFARNAPGMDWRTFFEAAGLAQQQVIVAWQPSAIAGVAALVASRPLESWKDYLRFHVLDEYASVLPRAFAEAAAVKHGDQRTRDQFALETTQSSMAGPIGELYAARYFSPAQKARVRGIIANVTAAFRQHVTHAAWLSRASREIALAKIDRLYVGIGFPERWEDWSDLRIDPVDAFGNLQRVADRNRRQALARLGKPYDSKEWVWNPQSVGAVLVFQQNAYEFAAALLQPPKYDSTASDAATYGAIGAIIGHDVSHFVDVLGADYEPDGRMHRWWTADDSARFEAAAEPIVRQFSEYEPLPGLHVNGRLTRTENVADLAGLTAAFEAYRKSLGAGSKDKDYVRREDRDFFIAFAQAFRTKMNETAMRTQLATDHAPEMYRMDTVRNLDAWYEAFDVVPGQRLYLEPRQRVHIW